MCPSRVADGDERGWIVPIGGAEEKENDPAILKRFVRLCGGKDADLVVIPTASRMDDTGDRYEAIFKEIGVKRVKALNFREREDASKEKWVERIERASGVFFTGGDQLRITTVLGGTLTDSALQSLVRSGTIVLGGTSAGAAMMSGTMILGGDGPGVARDSVRTGPGLELLPGVLIDMHFAERGRLNRLLSAVALYPHELGLGIDEDTAILADGDSFEVLGTGAVTVVDAGAAADIRVPAEGPITLTGARVHVLPAGCRFELSGRRPAIVAAAERELAA